MLLSDATLEIGCMEISAKITLKGDLNHHQETGTRSFTNPATHSCLVKIQVGKRAQYLNTTIRLSPKYT